MKHCHTDEAAGSPTGSSALGQMDRLLHVENVAEP